MSLSTPSSKQSLRRKALVVEIERTGIEMAPCHRCRAARVPVLAERPKCVVSPRSGRCSECIRKGYSDCDVTLSAHEWTKFRDIRDGLQRDLERAEEKEVELLHQQAELAQRIIRQKAKKIRLRKQLRLASGKADDAVAKELEELEAEDREEGGVSSVETTASDKEFDPWQMSPQAWDQPCDPSFPWTVPPLVSSSSSNQEAAV